MITRVSDSSAGSERYHWETVVRLLETSREAKQTNLSPGELSEGLIASLARLSLCMSGS